MYDGPMEEEVKFIRGKRIGKMRSLWVLKIGREGKAEGNR